MGGAKIQEEKLTKAYKQPHKQFYKAVVAPNKWILDNETSVGLQNVMKKSNTKFNLVPPHTY